MEGLEDRTAPAAQMVLDVNTSTKSSWPGEMVAIGSTIYFVADDGIHGRELWKTDGTASGTVMMKDIFPGSFVGTSGSFPNSSHPSYLTNVNGTLYFTADDGVNGSELWKSDGTAAGTVMIKDIWAGSGGSGANDFEVVNGVLFFTANDLVHRYELWKTDGTTAGTVMVKDIVPGGIGSNPAFLTNVNGTLLFQANNYSNGFELWKSDGTAAGTVLVKDIRPGSASSYIWNPIVDGGTLYFAANNGANGRELWKSDGTADGTVMVMDIRPGWDHSYPSDIAIVDGTLLFSADDGTNGRELWKSDGTESGTTLVKDIFPGSHTGPYGQTYLNSSNPANLTNVNGTVFFSAFGDTDGQELWKSDGTETGTVLVQDFNPGNAGTILAYLTSVNGLLLFSGNDGTGRELWKSDGTTAGTVLIEDIGPGSFSSDPRNLTSINGILYAAVYGTQNAASGDRWLGYDLWRSDGTAEGTFLVKDINETTYDSLPSNLTDVNGTLFFSAGDGTSGLELWKSDGTPAGTNLVEDIFPGSQLNQYGAALINNSNPANLINVNGTLFFSADNGTNGRELWKSDGTAAGTTLVKDIRSGVASSGLGGLTNVNGTLFFTADDGTTGPELWKSDGTVAGTVLVRDVWPGGAGSAPSSLTNVNGTLYFVADNGSNGRELWKSDATAAGTVLVKDVRPGGAASYPNYLTNVNGTLYFAADDGATGIELWRSDGTTAGTALVRDIFPGGYIGYYGGYYLNSSAPGGLTAVNGTLFFAATTDSTGRELWKSNGTSAGTALVKDIYPGNGGPPPDHLTDVNGKLYFTADDATNGRELWGTDGTPAGTTLVRDLRGGSGGSQPADLTNVLGILYFTAQDGGPMSKLWRTDGTTAGTVLVADVPADALVTSGNTLRFAADDGTHGWEPWTIVGDTPAITIDDVTVTEGHAGPTAATFTVRLSGPTDVPVVVGFATVAGTATAGGDYQPASGSLAFAPGQTSKTVTVVVNGDRLPEGNETFFVDLGGAINATVIDGRALGTIREDEPAIRIEKVTQAEGGPNRVTLFVFTVRLSVPYDLPVTVSFRTVDGTARVADGDYVARTGTLTFAPGETVQTITIEVRNDSVREADETFTVELFGNSAYSRLVDPTGLGTILNDD